jgi:hypothetical protein
MKVLKNDIAWKILSRANENDRTKTLCQAHSHQLELYFLSSFWLTMAIYILKSKDNRVIQLMVFMVGKAIETDNQSLLVVPYLYCEEKGEFTKQL